MPPFYQLICTVISLILNVILIYLIIFKSPKQTGKYKYLMIYTAVFEIIWGLFDLPAEVGSWSHGYAFIVYRVNHPWSWLTDTQSTYVVVVYAGIFGASMAIFGAHFIYRYGHINKSFGDKVTSGWKFSLLFIVPLVFAVWWGATIAYFFWHTNESDDYSREAFWNQFHIKIEDISYTPAMFYRTLESGRKVIRVEAWIGVANMFTMVIISMFCVFFFGYRCYRELSNEISELATLSKVTKNFQKQLFYALMVQTLIPLILIHIPICGYFLCPMFDLDYDFASNFLLATITLYPAIDPLPSFVIIKNYRKAVKCKVKTRIKEVEKRRLGTFNKWVTCSVCKRNQKNVRRPKKDPERTSSIAVISSQL